MLQDSCAGDAVKNGACTHKAVKAGKNAWRRVAAVPPENRLEVKTAPNKTPQPKAAVIGKPKDDKGKAKAARKGKGTAGSR